MKWKRQTENPDSGSIETFPRVHHILQDGTKSMSMSLLLANHWYDGSLFPNRKANMKIECTRFRMEINSRLFQFCLVSLGFEMGNNSWRDKRNEWTSTRWKAWIDKWIFRTSNISISVAIEIPNHVHGKCISYNPRKDKQPTAKQQQFGNCDESKWSTNEESKSISVIRQVVSTQREEMNRCL